VATTRTASIVICFARVGVSKDCDTDSKMIFDDVTFEPG